ncbi:hypothetical protein ILUMI_21762 [Ignelater luminosus]|uniref:Uncharacterized protein n=1 Tax=Ignelater luminosus TaxID=2038154 RepID=A0A8K0G3I9_IGNLU|nr:hypothetical protein ILUMI_21762 [Ignelater luminosus]
MNAIVRVPCARGLDMNDENVRTMLLRLFDFIIFYKKIQIISVHALGSANNPCGWDVYFQHEKTLEDQILEEGVILGLEDFIFKILEKQKQLFKINIKDFCLEFNDKNKGRIAFHINCDCHHENFDKITTPVANIVIN